MEEEYKLEWHYLPELPPPHKEVLIAYMYDEFPIIGYVNNDKVWYGSKETKDYLRDGYVEDSRLDCLNYMVAWAFLPYTPKKCRYPNE